jgi:hypothetical protein
MSDFPSIEFALMLRIFTAVSFAIALCSVSSAHAAGFALEIVVSVRSSRA